MSWLKANWSYLLGVVIPVITGILMHVSQGAAERGFAHWLVLLAAVIPTLIHQASSADVKKAFDRRSETRQRSLKGHQVLS